MAYETDEEKVEALKKWWKDNGLAVVAGTVIGLGSIYGWHLWQDYREGRAGRASAAFEQMLDNALVQQPDVAAVTQQAKAIADDFSATPYHALSALLAARVQYQNDQGKDASESLRAAIDAAPDTALARLAALRLAHLQLAEGQPEAAAKTVEQYDDGGAFSGEFSVVRGDLALLAGDVAAARNHYQTAIDKDSSLAQLLRLKLDNLPATNS